MQDTIKPEQELNISNLIVKQVNDRKVMVEYKFGISFELKYMPRQELQRMIKACTISRYNVQRKNHVPELDTDLLMQKVCDRCVTGWEGVTPKSMSNLVLTDLNSVSAEKRDMPVRFSQENLLALVKAAYELDEFLQNACTEASLFNPTEEAERKNSEPSQSGS